MTDIRLKQYVYIAINSQTLSSDEIETKLGIRADKHEAWGVKKHERDASWPVTNSWQLICKKNIRVDEQVEVLTSRLALAKDPLVELVNDQFVEVTLQVVRYFDHEAGQTEIIDADGDFVKLLGQHQLLGWNISADALAFLSSIKANLDVDEYN